MLLVLVCQGGADLEAITWGSHAMHSPTAAMHNATAVMPCTVPLQPCHAQCHCCHAMTWHDLSVAELCTEGFKQIHISYL